MCSELCFEIPYPIGTNAAYKVGTVTVNGVKRGRMYMTPEAKKFKSDVEQIARATMNRLGFDVSEHDKLGFQMELYPSDMRKDTDGGIKLTKDAVADGLGINDRCFWEDHAYRKPVDKDNPRAVVYIWKLV